jgi:hypothetical protein
MEIGKTYYIVRRKDGKYPTPREGKAAGSLVAFEDNERAIEWAKRFGEEAVVEHKPRQDAMALARREGFATVAVRHGAEPETYTLVDVASWTPPRDE